VIGFIGTFYSLLGTTSSAGLSKDNDRFAGRDLLETDKWVTQRKEKNRAIDQESKTDGREDKTNIKLRKYRKKKN
jgi:hypothetical protein